MGPPTQPPGIEVQNEGGIELTAELTPANGVVRNRHEVSLQNGQLEFSLPLGIGGEGVAGHGVSPEIIFRSGISNPGSPMGMFWSLSETDIIVIECSIEVDNFSTAEVSVNQALQSAGTIKRVKAGRMELWTNVNAIDGTEAFAGDSLQFGVLDSTLSACHVWGFDDALGHPPINLGWLGNSGPNDDAPVGMVASGATDPYFIFLGRPTPPEIPAFVPPTGVSDKLHWDCNHGAVIREPNGTIHRYSAFFKRGETQMTGSLPHGGRGAGSVGFGQSAFRFMLKSHRTMTEYPDGQRVTYGYGPWGRLTRITDTLGRHISIEYDANVGGGISAIEDWSGRRVDFEYSDTTGEGVPFLNYVTTPAVSVDEAPVGSGNDFPLGKKWDFGYSVVVEPPRVPFFGAHAPNRYFVSGFTAKAPKDSSPYLSANFAEVYSTWRVANVRSGKPTDPQYPSGGQTVYDWKPRENLCSTDGWDLVVSDPNGFQEHHFFDRYVNEIKVFDLRDPSDPNDDVLIVERDYGEQQYGRTNPFHMVESEHTALEKQTTTYLYQFRKYLEEDPSGVLNTRDRFQFPNVLATNSDAVNGGNILHKTIYEPLFNRQWKQIDPRGQPGQEAAYTTENVFDYMEGSLADVLPLSIKWGIDHSSIVNEFGKVGNGDSNIRQRGNVVQTIYPTVTVGIAAENGAQTAVETFFYNDESQLKRQVDAEGYATETIFYTRQDPYGDVPTAFGLGGYPARIRKDVVLNDPSPLETQFLKYNLYGDPVVIVSPESRVAYKRINERGQVWREVMGDVDPTTGAESPNGGAYSVTEYLFDLNDNVIERWRENDNPHTSGVAATVIDKFEYDALDRMRLQQLHLVDPITLSERWIETFFHYDPNGNVIHKSTQQGLEQGQPVFIAQSAIYTYQNKLEEFRRHALLDADPGDGVPPSLDSQDYVIQFSYDDDQNLTDSVDSEGTHWRFEYDGFNRRFRTANDDEQISRTLSFDSASLVTQETIEGPVRGPSSVVAVLKREHFRYDEKQRFYELERQHFWFDEGSGQQVDHPAGHSISQYGFDPRDLMTKEIDPNGNDTLFEFDGLKRVRLSLSPQVGGLPRNQLESFYDGDDNLIETSQSEYGLDNGQTVSGLYVAQFEFDELNRQVAQIEEPNNPALSARTTTGFDSLGNVIWSRNSNKEEFEQGGESGVGTVHKVDTRGRTRHSSFGHGAWGSVLLGDLPDGLIDKTTIYNDQGEVVADIDDRGKATTYAYDRQNRRLKVTFADGTWEENVLRTDGLIDQFIARSGGGATLFYVDSLYDDAKRLTEESITAVDPVFQNAGVFHRSMTVDGLDRIVGTTNTSKDPFDLATYTAYTDRVMDSLGNVRNEIQSLEEIGVGVLHSATVDCDHDGLGNKLSTQVGNDYSIGYGYDELNRCSIVSSLNGSTVYSTSNFMGPARRTLSKQFVFNGTQGALSWDGRRRPTATTHSDANSGLLWGATYDYTRTSNRVFEHKTHDTSKNRDFAYDAADRLTENTGYRPEAFTLDGVGNWVDHSLDGSPTYSNSVGELNEYDSTFDGDVIDHDLRGNTIQVGTEVCSYDVYGRIVKSVNVPAQQILSFVYDAGGRRVAKLDHDASQRTDYVFENAKCLLQREDGTTNVRYVWQNGHELTLVEVGGVLHSAHVDPIGSVVALANTTGDLVERYDYDAYGAVEVEDVNGGGFVGNMHLWAGHYYEPDLNLYCFPARWYSPKMGRFTSRDPIGIWGDLATRGNPYSYGPGNPYGGLDPSGESWREFGVGFIAGGVEFLSGGYVSAEAIAKGAGVDPDSGSFIAGRGIGAVTIGTAAHSLSGGITTVAAMALAAGRVTEGGINGELSGGDVVVGLFIEATGTHIKMSAGVRTTQPGAEAGTGTTTTRVVSGKLSNDGVEFTSTTTTKWGVDEYLNSAAKGENGKTRKFGMNGGFDEANKDFDRLLGEGAAKDYGGGLRSGKLPDGTKIRVRPHSDEGSPTLQIDPPTGKSAKVRYKEDKGEK